MEGAWCRAHLTPPEVGEGDDNYDLLLNSLANSIDQEIKRFMYSYKRMVAEWFIQCKKSLKGGRVKGEDNCYSIFKAGDAAGGAFCSTDGSL